MKFKSKKPPYEYLQKKWKARHKSAQNKFWENHKEQLDIFTKTVPTRQLLVGGLGGLMLMTTPTNFALSSPHLLVGGDHITADEDKNIGLSKLLADKLPEQMRALTVEEEGDIADILTDSFGFSVKAEIEGKRLNRSYGLIGGEQHLYRYPGDNLPSHSETAADWVMYGPSGIAPGLGAWGYFAPSKSDFSDKEKMRERYYLAVQTFLAPGFSERVAEYRDFFKYRKMLVVNPKTGQSVVAVIGDAGPAEWTGKHLGGSPEVMHYLGMATGPRKGAVLYFFIDDPNDSIPLGSVTVKNIAKI